MNDPGSVKIVRARCTTVSVRSGGFSVTVFLARRKTKKKKKKEKRKKRDVSSPAKLHVDGSLTSKGMCTHDFRQHGIKFFARDTVNMTNPLFACLIQGDISPTLFLNACIFQLKN
ncbi:hypothetical protein P5V15_006284 [Pogonomyrmex californicus]